MNEFVTWDVLATFAGAVAMTTVLTQLFKNFNFAKKINPQLGSLIFALIILTVATHFTKGLTAETFTLVLFNAVIVSLTANGGFDAIKTIFMGNPTQGQLIQQGMDDKYEIILNETLGDLAARNIVKLEVKKQDSLK